MRDDTLYKAWISTRFVLVPSLSILNRLVENVFGSEASCAGAASSTVL